MSSLGPVSAEQIRLRQQLAAWLTYLPVWGLRGVSSFQVEVAYYRWDPAEYWEARPPNTPVTHGAHCRRKSRPEPDLEKWQEWRFQEEWRLLRWVTRVKFGGRCSTQPARRVTAVREGSVQFWTWEHPGGEMFFGSELKKNSQSVDD